MIWVEITLADALFNMSTDLRALYEQWLGQYPEKAGRLQQIVDNTIREFRDALASGDNAILDPRETWLPQSAVRHCYSIIYFELGMEMSVPLTGAASGAKTSADVYLRSLPFGRYKVTVPGPSGTGVQEPTPRFTIPARRDTYGTAILYQFSVALMFILVLLGCASPKRVDSSSAGGLKSWVNTTQQGVVQNVGAVSVTNYWTFTNNIANTFDVTGVRVTNNFSPELNITNNTYVTQTNIFIFNEKTDFRTGISHTNTSGVFTNTPDSVSFWVDNRIATSLVIGTHQDIYLSSQLGGSIINTSVTFASTSSVPGFLGVNINTYHPGPGVASYAEISAARDYSARFGGLLRLGQTPATSFEIFASSIDMDFRHAGNIAFNMLRLQTNQATFGVPLTAPTGTFFTAIATNLTVTNLNVSSISASTGRTLRITGHPSYLGSGFTYNSAGAVHVTGGDGTVWSQNGGDVLVSGGVPLFAPPSYNGVRGRVVLSNVTDVYFWNGGRLTNVPDSISASSASNLFVSYNRQTVQSVRSLSVTNAFMEAITADVFRVNRSFDISFPYPSASAGTPGYIRNVGNDIVLRPSDYEYYADGRLLIRMNSNTSPYAEFDAFQVTPSAAIFSVPMFGNASGLSNFPSQIITTNNLSAIAGSGLGVTANQLVVTNSGSEASFTNWLATNTYIYAAVNEYISSSVTPSFSSIGGRQIVHYMRAGGGTISASNSGNGGDQIVRITQPSNSKGQSATLSGFGSIQRGSMINAASTSSVSGANSIGLFYFTSDGQSQQITGNGSIALGGVVQTNSHSLYASGFIQSDSGFRGSASALTNFPSSLLTVSASSNFWRITTAPLSNNAFGQLGDMAISGTNLFVYNPDALGTGTGRWGRVGLNIEW